MKKYNREIKFRPNSKARAKTKLFEKERGQILKLLSKLRMEVKT